MDGRKLGSAFANGGSRMRWARRKLNLSNQGLRSFDPPAPYRSPPSPPSSSWLHRDHCADIKLPSPPQRVVVFRIRCDRIGGSHERTGCSFRCLAYLPSVPTTRLGRPGENRSRLNGSSKPSKAISAASAARRASHAAIAVLLRAANVVSRRGAHAKQETNDQPPCDYVGWTARDSAAWRQPRAGGECGSV
jgi:hypothetical protein